MAETLANLYLWLLFAVLGMVIVSVVVSLLAKIVYQMSRRV
jgi:Na+-transporting methylmalonyl-CoA/oxaloacetate decarboxylase gamma subunit